MVLLGLTVAATPLVTEMLPGVMTPVPFANTPVSEALPPAVMEAGLAEKLEIEAAGGAEDPEEPPQPMNVAMTVARAMMDAALAKRRFMRIPK